MYRTAKFRILSLLTISRQCYARNDADGEIPRRAGRTLHREVPSCLNTWASQNNVTKWSIVQGEVTPALLYREPTAGANRMDAVR